MTSLHLANLCLQFFVGVLEVELSLLHRFGVFAEFLLVFLQLFGHFLCIAEEFLCLGVYLKVEDGLGDDFAYFFDKVECLVRQVGQEGRKFDDALQFFVADKWRQQEGLWFLVSEDA